MKRREFITLLAAAAATGSLPLRAQDDSVRRVGVLMFSPERDAESQDLIAAFREGLEDLGWMVGKDLLILQRWNVVDAATARAAATELLTLAPDVILAVASPAVQGLLAITHTVPAVFTFVTDPLAQGFVESLERPGGNLTGFSHLPPAIGENWVSLLKEVAPQVTRVGFITNPRASTRGGQFFDSIRDAALKSSARATLLPVFEPGEVNRALEILSREGDGGLIVGTDNFTGMHRRLIFDLAKRYRLPTVASDRDYLAAGGLLSYGINGDDHVKQAASYVDRVLRGEKPADLPVEEPDEFELVINMKTARAIGVTVPPTMKMDADDVLE